MAMPLPRASALPIHPLLVALAPVLSMYAWLPGRAEPAEVVLSCAVALAAAVLLLGVSGAIFRDWRKAALFVSIALIVYVAAGRGYGSVEEWQFAGVRLLRRRYFVPLVYVALAAMGIALYRLRRPLNTLTTLANIVAFGALLPPLLVLAQAQLMPRRRVPQPVLAPIVAVRTPEAQPDIYYMVFDRYGDRAAVGARGVDNTDFYRYLEQRGFYIAAESRANYIKTVLSLASSLNLDYLDDLARAYGGDPHHWGPIHERVRNHRAGAFLR